jgi:GH15 family glucan-1,4-alpha-glucosidase
MGRIMNVGTIFTITAALAFGALPSAVSAQAPKHVHFIPESLAEYSAAYQQHSRVQLDSRHAHVTKYRAYRFLQTGNTMSVIVARSVRVDSAGDLHITLEPGTVVEGRPSSGSSYAHILLPASVSPPQ